MVDVTVILPVYNSAEYLHQCMDSIIDQSLQEIEIICVDDGSTDESPKILQSYAAQDERITVLHQENLGAGAARNAGLKRASGEYLVFLDSDDWFELDYLERALRKARETGADVTVSGAVEFDSATGRELPSEWMLDSEGLPESGFSPDMAADRIFSFTHGWPWDKLYRTSFVQEKRLTFPGLRNSEDLVFVYESLTVAHTVAILPTCMVHHRQRMSGSVSGGRAKDPSAPYEALLLLRQRLKAESVYPVFEGAFLRWALGFLIWHVGYLPDKTAQKKCFKMMQKYWLRELGCWEHPTEFSSDRMTKIKYFMARYAPYPVFAAAMKLHQERKRRQNQ